MTSEASGHYFVVVILFELSKLHRADGVAITLDFTFASIDSIAFMTLMPMTTCLMMMMIRMALSSSG